MPTISVITPTFGRTTIRACLESVVPQLQEGDEYIVVGDGPCPNSRAICAEFPRATYLETEAHVGDYGCTPIDFGIAHAKGDYVMFLGDDNLPTPDALAIVKAEIIPVPHLFSMQHSGRILRNSHECAQVDNQQLVVPRDMTKMPKMADVEQQEWICSDWVFVEKVIKAWGSVVYSDKVICVLERQNFGKML